MTTDPGAQRTDELARNAAYLTIRDMLGEGHGPANISRPESSRKVADQHAVTWEHDVNSAGVPVRRYVLRGAWEVDPNSPASPASPADGVEWHRHTHDMWVGEGYGAKVLVEVDGLATSSREKWRARTFTNGEDSKTISDAPLTLAKAKHDGVKYLWSRRRESVTPSPVAALAADAMMVLVAPQPLDSDLPHGVAETYGPHPFVGTRYKGRDIDSCSHVTMISTHEGSMCAAGADDPVHLPRRNPEARPHCEVVDGPCPGNERGVICGKPCEEDQTVSTRIV